jgi:hypothetical protein
MTTVLPYASTVLLPSTPVPPCVGGTAFRARELHSIIQNGRYPLSPRIVTLKEILGMMRPEPEREPLPPRRHYEPPGQGRGPATPRVIALAVKISR